MIDRSETLEETPAATSREPEIPCPHCRGSGKSALPRKLLSTYRAIESLGSGTVPEIYNRLNKPNSDQTATNHRVKRLVALGMVRATNRKRPLVYTLAT